MCPRCGAAAEVLEVLEPLTPGWQWITYRCERKECGHLWTEESEELERFSTDEESEGQ